MLFLAGSSCFVDLDHLRNGKCPEGLSPCGGRCLPSCPPELSGTGGTAIADASETLDAAADETGAALVDAKATEATVPRDASSCADGSNCSDSSAGDGSRTEGGHPPNNADARDPDGDGPTTDGEDARVEAGPSTASCPTNLPGPPQVLVNAGSTRYCIDATEVTVAQYSAFLAARGNQTGEPARCAGHSYDRQDVSCLDDSNPNFPVDGVDWCGAYMYCAWANKRLCGATNGGSGVFATSAIDQWALACGDGSASNTSGYPYGATYDATACNVHQGHLDAVTCPNSLRVTDHRQAVGSMTICRTPSGVFDMIGNSWEWVDACGADAYGNPQCLQRGGSWGETNLPQSYTCTAARQRAIGETGLDISFRCCYDLPP